ncbi:DoxX family protein [Catenuloplanes sp. NPDC051500]|uniref:DoxX family protein n=1 Tax=Catenuloplanes sp. NPDC051500 TaxID=3363959 RepID=UPI00378B9BED
MTEVRITVTVLMCVFLFTIGPLRVAAIPIARRDAARFGIPLPYYRAFGAVEILGGVSLLIGLTYRPIGVAGAVILALLGVGAVYVHVRAGEPPVKVGLAGLTTAAAVLLAAVSFGP